MYIFVHELSLNLNGIDSTTVPFQPDRRDQMHCVHPMYSGVHSNKVDLKLHLSVGALVITFLHQVHLVAMSLAVHQQFITCLLRIC
jgi:hypothetical protein